MIDLLIILLRPALMCVDGGSRKPQHILAALVALIADVSIAHTTLARAAGKPLKGEWTVSDMLERLVITPGEDQELYIQIAKKINRVSPTGRHIKSLGP